MSDGVEKRSWALLLSPEYQKDFKRLPQKYQMRIPLIVISLSTPS